MTERTSTAAAQTELRRIFFCTPGFEPALLAELPPGARATAALDHPGLVIVDESSPSAPLDPIFARQQLPSAHPLRASSVSTLAEACYRAVEPAIDAAAGPFTFHGTVPPGADPQLAARAALVVEQTLELLRQRRRRASRLYRAADTTVGEAAFAELRVLAQLLLLDREHGFASAARPQTLATGGWDLAPWPAGAPPVADDRRPPSRAYRKLEEAFVWIGAEPRPGELCVDLGAAPGGWTHGALARGAQVIAIDRAPLAPALARHPKLQAFAANAFTYRPPRRADWLLSDIVCDPGRALALMTAWAEGDLCRRMIVTVKFKGQESYGVLEQVRAKLAGIGWQRTRIKHLRHNKNEVTVLAVHPDD